MRARRGWGNLDELDDLDGGLLVEVEVGGLGVLVHEGRGRGVGGGQRGLCEHGGRAVVHVAGGGAGVEGAVYQEAATTGGRGEGQLAEQTRRF